MSSFRLAVAAWLVPATLVLFIGAVRWLDGVVPHPDFVAAPPCYPDPQGEPGETICPEPAPNPPSTLRSMVTTLAAEKVSAPLALFALVAGLGLSITVLVRTRTSRKSIAEDKTAFRVALAAMVVLCVVPSCAGAMLAAVVMSFPIRG